MKSFKHPSGTGGTSVFAANGQTLSCTVENFCLLKLSGLLDPDNAQRRLISGTQRFSQYVAF